MIYKYYIYIYDIWYIKYVWRSILGTKTGVFPVPVEIRQLGIGWEFSDPSHGKFGKQKWGFLNGTTVLICFICILFFMFFMLANLTIIKHHKQSCVLWSSNHLVLGLQTVRFPYCNCLKVSPSSKLEPWEGTRLSGRVVIWVCLKMGYTSNYSHLVGIMIINHWV